MKSPLKIGLIGLGEHMWDNLLPSIVLNKSVTIDSVCDIDEDKLNLAKQKFCLNTYVSYQEMLNQRQIDCLVVASYPQVHYEVIKLALDKEIPIFVEKPPVTNLSELKELMNHPKFHLLISGIGINFAYAENLLILNKLMQKEDFGNIKYLNISHLANKPSEPLWNLDNLSESFLLAQAIHPLSFALDFGKDYKIRALEYTKENNLFFLNLNLEIARDDTSFIANITSGTCAPHFEWNMELITDKGKIVRINSLWELELLDSAKKTTLIDDTKRWKDVWHPSPVGNGLKRTGYYHELRSFFECVQSKKTFHPNMKDMLMVYQLLGYIKDNLVIKK